MQPTKFETADQSASFLFFQWFLILIVIVLPLILLGILFTTSLYQTIGRTVGVNLERDSNLIIYNAVCREAPNADSLNVIFWTSESAPITVIADNLTSQEIPSPAGINTLDITLRKAGESCPASITLKDNSRNRIAGGSVEVLK